MSSAQSPARSPKPVVRRPLALAPRPAAPPRASSGRRIDVGTLADDLRCECGRLLAKVVAGGLEIRCTRCKASHVLAWSEVEGARELLGDAIAPAEARSPEQPPHDP
jgi:hypothetical protein